LLLCGANLDNDGKIIGELARKHSSGHLPASESLRNTIGHSMERARFYQAKKVEPVHFFFAMVDLNTTPAALSLMPHFDLRAFLDTILPQSPTDFKIASAGLDEAALFKQLDGKTLAILRRASDEAARRDSNQIDSEHLLLALLHIPSQGQGQGLLRCLIDGAGTKGPARPFIATP